ncbi:MAG: hypothetical protein NVS3B10_09830 [Polyangiales bacterium]
MTADGSGTDAGDASVADSVADAADASDAPDTHDTRSDAIGATDATDGGGPAYPAFRPDVPVVKSAGGPVLAAPVIVPVVFPATEFKTEIDDFVAKGVVSAEWTAQLTEYGVGPGTAVASVASTKLPSASITQADLETFVHDQIAAGAWGAADTTEFGSQFYVLFLPAAVTITLPSGMATCTGPYGYHREVLVGATHTPYAVVANCGKGVDPVTKIAWHEIVEGCADPYIAPNRAFGQTVPSWAIAFHGGEIGDMCEHRTDQKITPTDIGYAVQRTWSNVAALGYHDPCVPAPGLPFFAAAPVLPGTVTVNTATVPGVTIAVGASATIDVQLFSDAPTSGPWDVSAKESRGGTTLSFAWDKTSGSNGDVLHLTITADAAAPTGTTFEILSVLGAASSQWVGAVAN